MPAIAISRVHFPVTTLGPGRRLGIWVQGCSIRCPGCISADTWAQGRGVVEVAELIAKLKPWLAEADGITISGGEPFDQPEALQALLERLRASTRVDVLVYSGHPLEALVEYLAHMHGLIDAVITDPFLADASQTLALRGSDNQRLTALTPVGAARFDRFKDDRRQTRALDIVLDEDGTLWIAGIPRREDWKNFQAGLNGRGHSFITSEDAGLRRRGTGGR